MSKLLRSAAVLVFSLTWFVESNAADTASKAAPAKKAPGKPDAAVATDGRRGIRLDDYLRKLDPKWIVERMDTSGQGSPDIWVIFEKTEDGSRRLLMQLFDLNRDKKIDLMKFYEVGKLSRVEADLDYDGYADVISDYDTKTGELKKKTQADGLTNIWKYYFHSELRKKELDRNSDGKADMWVYYRNGKVVRTEIDQAFDGRIVRVEGPLNPTKGKKTAAKASGAISD